MKTIKELLPIEHPYVNAIINMLKEIDVDGETMEYILKQVGMDDQVVKQIIVTMNNVDLNSMLNERQTFLNSINKQYSFDSSHGELIINQHGDVLPKSELSDWLLGIEKVDVEELVHYYILNGFGNELCDGDVLDFGYWDKEGKYIEPDYYFREKTFHNQKFTDEQVKEAIDKSKEWIKKYRTI